jgi:hypothetical protein
MVCGDSCTYRPQTQVEAGDPGAKSTVLWLVGILSFNGSKILPQGTENLDNTEITESCLETMEEPEDQGS